MKNINLNILIVLVSLFVASCTNEAIDPIIDDTYISITDANFEKILIEQGIDSDSTVNQQILLADAQKVTRLDLDRREIPHTITDLTGIEGFTNLTFLSASGHGLEAIDLSYNTKLDTLSLDENALSTIDLSNNTHLKFINIMLNELNAITGLSNAQNLNMINLSYNNLEHISIDNETVKTISITHNLLKSIDISGAINLNSLLLTSNQLTTLDIEANLSLETVLVSVNELSNINLQNNRELTYFYASSNAFTSLDVSNNQKLVDLRVHRNPGLGCIKIETGQEIPTVWLDDYHELNDDCQ